MLRTRERGAALTVAVATAVVCGVASYAMLMMVASQSNRSRFFRLQTPAKYAAEAGTVWVQQRLWKDPSYCGATQSDLDGDGDLDGQDALTINGFSVTVTIKDCAGEHHEVRGTARY